ncbi:hypothetical protein A0J48_006975 [Sphaerospermopsis aphanizomenoides BCCUSP55]|uniref:hypothetical protein n=1 Tax=Sphaerospermopsis aphanizomenoides TaxID=459663 RepID=UPI0019043E1A|nr:hypothetical protein [Sphaerospermopsis aphanizomenoides]MBK1987279.1 hypothetical protein [Sphaerospermopsis aphanizomenoides BCCUSP55]
MINKLTVIEQLERIARNKDGEKLTHHEVTVIAYGILNVLDDVYGIDCRDEVELYLRMLTKRSPHHARCLQADQCIKYLRKGGESKKSEGSERLTPDNF